jgi:hypothetical protein
MPAAASNYSTSNDKGIADIWDKQPPMYKQAVVTSAGAAVLVVLTVAAIMAIFG